MTIRHDWERTDAASLRAVPRLDRAVRDRMTPQLGNVQSTAAAMTAEAEDMIPLPVSLLRQPATPRAGMTWGKRLFDVGLALMLLIPLSVVMLIVAGLLAVIEGRPIFYTSERMRGPGRGFRLIKFRTMKEDDDDSGVTGAHKHWRITPMGHFLRRTRIDELPQLFNILIGDMSFVGPRPTIREYVDRYPDSYHRILRSRPGVTGLATLLYHQHEARVLSRCTSAEETERAYARQCLPMKLRIDSIYQHHRTLALDLWIIGQTLAVVFLGRSRPRLPRRRSGAPRRD